MMKAEIGSVTVMLTAYPEAAVYEVTVSEAGNPVAKSFTYTTLDSAVEEFTDQVEVEAKQAAYDFTH